MGSIARIISNTFYLTLDWLVLTLGGYAYWILMSKTLAIGDVGRFSTILNTGLFLAGISGVGMNIAITKLLPEYQLKNDYRSIHGAILWTLKVTTLVSLSAGALFLAASQLGLPGFGLYNTADAFSIAIMLLLANSIYMTTSYLFGLQKMKELFLSDTFITASKLLFTLPLIAMGFGYFGAVYGFVAASAITFFLRLKWLPSGEGKADKKMILHYSLPILASSFGVMAVNQGSIVLLGILSTPTGVGLFSILFYITSPIRMIPQLISQGMFPTTAQKWISNETQNIKTMISRSVKYSLFLVAPIALVLSIFSKDVLTLLTTPDYLPVAGIFLYMSLAYLFLGIATIFNNMLYSAGDVIAYRNSNLLGGFTNAVAGLFLIPGFGVAGAVGAFLLATFLMLAASFYLLRKKISFEIETGDIAKLSAACAALLATAGYLSWSSSLAWIFAAAAGSAIYLGSLLFLKFFDKFDVRVIEELEVKLSGNRRAFVKRLRTFLNKFTV